MRARLWYEMGQAKFNQDYACMLIGFQKGILNSFNIIIAIFSTAGVMGWKLWDKIPIVACVIIATISLIRLVQPYLIPSEKQIEKLDKIADFYFDFYLKLEKLWFDSEADRIDQVELQSQFHLLKQSERPINKIINEVHRHEKKKYVSLAKIKCDNFFKYSFNISHHE